MPPVKFEPKISAGEGPQTYSFERAATGTDRRAAYPNIFKRCDVHLLQTLD